MRTIEELRAIVGEDGRDWSDDQLRRAADASAAHARLLVEAHVDRLHPAAAQAREARRLVEREMDLSRRRGRYPREREARSTKRDAARRSA